MANPARWRLMNPHYLFVEPSTQWHYEEIDRDTGQQGRKSFSVPRYLNPANEREAIVANAKSREWPQDIVYLGEPTPDMEPLNEEADAISASFAHKWKHPIESLPGDFSASLITKLEKEITNLSRNPSAAAVSIPVDEFKALQAQVAELAGKNSLLEAQIAEKPATARRA